MYYIIYINICQKIKTAIRGFDYIAANFFIYSWFEKFHFLAENLILLSVN